MKKLLSSAVAIASVIGVCALPSQVSAGADSSSGDILGIAGSDTTTFVMDALSSAHNTSSRYNPNKDRAVNIPPLVAANPNVELGESTGCGVEPTKNLVRQEKVAPFKPERIDAGARKVGRVDPTSRALLGRLVARADADPSRVFLFGRSLGGAVALAASWVPARRASRIDIAEALRYE